MPDNSAEDFADALTDFHQEAAESVMMLYAAIVLEAYRRITMRTPVDTGRARANWQVDAIPTTAVVAEGPLTIRKTRTLKDKRKQARLEKLARKEALRQMFNALSIKQQQEAIQFVQNLDLETASYIINNVEYINSLEHGHSRQAPEGMVAVTLEELRVIAEQQSAELLKVTGVHFKPGLKEVGIEVSGT